MAYIGRQQTSSTFLKLDDISSQFNASTTTFNLTLGGQAFFAGNPYSLLVSLGGVIQEPIASFTIVENQINFASAPRKEGQVISIGFLALLSPLWGMLFGIFGLAPIISRTNDLLPLFKNGLAFTAAGIAGYILSQTLFSRYEKPKNT